MFVRSPDENTGTTKPPLTESVPSAKDAVAFGNEMTKAQKDAAVQLAQGYYRYLPGPVYPPAYEPSWRPGSSRAQRYWQEQQRLNYDYDALQYYMRHGGGGPRGPSREEDESSARRLPPCVTVSGKVVAVGTLAYRPLDIPPPGQIQHGISGPHYNMYRANQNPNNGQCFWQSVGAIPAHALPVEAIPIETFLPPPP